MWEFREKLVADWILGLRAGELSVSDFAEWVDEI